METAKVYRNGAVRPGKHSEQIYLLWGTYDRIKPQGRAGRLNSVYASPSLAGMVRWTHTNHMGSIPSTRDMASYEITVRNPAELFVYDVSVYDRTTSELHCYGDIGNPEYASYNAELLQPYWDTGIPFTDWERVSAEKNLNPMDWEVLVPMDSIVSHAVIPHSAIIDAAPEDSKENLRETLRIYSEFRAWWDSEEGKEAQIEDPDLAIAISAGV